MATSGTINNTFRTGYAVRIVWTENSQDIAGNSSNITAKVQLVSLGASYTISSSASKSGSLTINGTKYTFTFTSALSGNQTKTICTKTVDVKHNADGTKTCAFACTAGINVTLSGTYWGNVSASGNGTFDTIPRASSISSVTSSVAINGTNTCTVSISRASSAFTHTVVWKFGTYSKTTTGAGTSSSYAIPTSWMNAMPSATSGTGTVTVTTYNGSTKIGSAVSKSFKLTVPATVVPTISSVAVADTTTHQTTFGNMVQGKSKPKFTISAAGAYSSTIKTYKTVFEGKTYTGATPTAGAISGSGSVTATITVTDSRGRTASTKKTWTVVAYSMPTISAFEGTRAFSDGTENYEGTHLKAEIGLSVASLNAKNTPSYALDYRAQGEMTWTALTSGTDFSYSATWISPDGFLNADSSYSVRLTVKDYFSTVTKTIEVPTAFTLLDFNASGHGVAFGKVSEKDGVEFALPTYFSHAETPSSAKYLQGGEDLNDLQEPGFYVITNSTISGTLLNKPWTSTATGSVTVIREGDGIGRCQIAHKLSKTDSGIYERSYYQNAWGDWVTVHNGKGKILWSGGMYMTGGHIIAFSEPVSKQPQGIVLVFSEYYDGEARNQTFACHFIPKALIAAHSGSGHSFWMSTSNGTYIATKYLYVRDDGITGHANNALTFTNSGVTLNNNRFVLRYVIGV